jgi:hypothetical protein
MLCSNYHGGKLLATEDDCNGEDGTFYSEGCDEDSCGCCVQVGELVGWRRVCPAGLIEADLFRCI